ncbi:MAG: PAS domain S-box protein [Cyanobacteria bacterium P01_F01_bin.150]
MLNSYEEWKSAIIWNPVALPLNAKVLDAIAQMNDQPAVWEKGDRTDREFLPNPPGSSCVVIVDEQQVVGLLTERDVVSLVGQGIALGDLTLQDVLKNVPITIRASALNDFRAILNFFQQHQVSHLPILDDTDQLVGLITHVGLHQAISTVFLQQSAPDESLHTKSIVHPQLDTIDGICDVKQGDQELTLKHNYLEALLNNIPHLAWIKDQESRFIAVNEPFAQVCDTPAEDIVGKTDYDIWPNELAKAYRNDDFRVLRSNQRKVVEERIAHADGTLRWIETTKTPFRDAQDRLAGTVGIAVDISDRKQAEDLLTDYNCTLEQQVEERTQALQRSEAALLKAQQVAHVGNWEFDIASQSVTWSPEMFRIYELDPTLGAPSYSEYLQLLLPESRQLVHQAVERAILEGIPYKIEYSRPRADGVVSYHECRAEVEKDEQGQVIRLLGSTLDITERKQAELALQNLIAGTAATIGEDFFPALVQHIATALGASHAFVTEIVDDGSRLYFLAAWADGEHLPNDTVDAAGTTCLLALEQETYYCERDVITCFPENPRLAPMGVDSYMGVALKNRSGQSIGTLCIFARQSIADPEHAEQILRVFGARASAEIERQHGQSALEQLNAELEQRVEKRTQELASSEQDLRTIFNNVYDAIYIYDLDGTILDINARALEQLGATREQILSSKIFDISAPDVPIERIPELFRRANAGEELKFEWKKQRLSDGAVFDVEVSLKKVVLGNQAVTVAGVRDISDRKQAERALQLSEARATATFTQAAVGIFETHLASGGKITRFNDYFCTMLGYSHSELLEKNFMELTYEGDLTRCTELVEQLTSGDISDFLMEKRVIHKDGSLVWVLVSATMIQVPDGDNSTCLVVVQNISDRKATEQQLQKLSERWELAIESAQIGIWDWNGEDNRLSWDKQMFEIYGVRPEDFRGSYQDWQERVHPDDLVQYETGREVRTQKQAKDYTQEFRVIRPDGTIRYVLSTAFIERDTQGQPIRMVGTNLDITKRKEADLALKAAQAQFRHMTENVPGMIYRYVLHPDGRHGLSYVSSQVREIYELDPEVVLQDVSHLQERIHADDRAKTDAVSRHSAEMLTPFTVEHRLVLPRKGIRWIQAIARPERLDNGDIVWDGVAIDISDRKQAELALEQEILRRATIFDASSDGIHIIDTEGNLLEANANFTQMLGYTSAEVAHLNVADWDAQWSRAELQEIIQTYAQETSSIWRFETLHRRKDGSIFPVEISECTMEWNGQVSLVCISRDISERKQAEVQLQRTNEELIRATRLKDEFLATMSHELRTPLSAILGLSEALQDTVFGPLTAKQLKYLRTIEQSGIHLLNLINDILDVSKIEAGQIELDLKATDLGCLCKASLAFVKQQALKKHISLTVTIPFYTLTPLVDERRITQSLVNLLNNAVKFTAENGAVALEIRHHQQNENQEILRLQSQPNAAQNPNQLVWESGPLTTSNYIQISVIDTGIGIDPENIEKLFKPFSQIDSALNRQYNGTGLGLVLVKQIAELHGGTVSLTSEVGVGSCFSINLPYDPDVFHLNSEPFFDDTNIPSIPDPVCPESSPLLLLAEDNEEMISWFTSYLEDCGYRLIVAKNGLEAIDLAQTHRPSLILMDIQLPELDGLECIQQIRQDSSLKPTPIIALTALAMAGDRERCLAAGANLYFSKPVKLKQLLHSIQILLA